METIFRNKHDNTFSSFYFSLYSLSKEAAEIKTRSEYSISF